MSDSEAESSRHSSSSNSGESLKQDHMSVSEHELEQCHEDDSIGICDDGDSDSELSPGERFGALPAVQTGVKTQDAATELMTGSYSEILSPRFQSDLVAAEEVPPVEMLSAEGTVLQEGDMIHFVAKNLETKIRLSSPEVPDGIEQTLQKANIEDTSICSQAVLLAQLEREARNIASSVDSLTEHLVVSLHTISAVTVESLTVYKDSVCKTCDAIDGNIKSMYQLMAKCEELSKAMTPLYKQAETVKEIKKLLDILENI